MTHVSGARGPCGRWRRGRHAQQRQARLHAEPSRAQVRREAPRSGRSALNFAGNDRDGVGTILPRACAATAVPLLHSVRGQCRWPRCSLASSESTQLPSCSAGSSPTAGGKAGELGGAGEVCTAEPPTCDPPTCDPPVGKTLALSREGVGEPTACELGVSFSSQEAACPCAGCNSTRGKHVLTKKRSSHVSVCRIKTHFL